MLAVLQFFDFRHIQSALILRCKMHQTCAICLILRVLLNTTYQKCLILLGRIEVGAGEGNRTLISTRILVWQTVDLTEIAAPFHIMPISNVPFRPRAGLASALPAPPAISEPMERHPF
jgi:hypothetical protein